MGSDIAPLAISSNQLDGPELPAAVEVVLLATTGHADVQAAVARLRDEAGSCRPAVAVVLVGAAATDRAVLERPDASTRYIDGASAGSIAEAWNLGMEATDAPWVLLISEDIRPEAHWLDRLMEHVDGHHDCVAVTPSVCSSARVGTTAAPASGRGVCLLVSRQALANGAIRRVEHVPQSRVALVDRPDDTRSATPSVEDASPRTAARDTPAPGGGAPPGALVWIDNRVHVGATAAEIRKRVHLGCGKNRIPGWLNVDGDEAGAPDLVADLRHGIPLPTGSVDLIYSEHLFEHCTLEQGMVLFAECYRVLAAGGVIRTAMPNLRDTVTYYLENWREQSWLKDFPQIDSPARMLNTCLREWGHQYVYDDEELSLRLQQSGFVGIEAARIGESRHAALRNLETRPESTLIFEATKP